MFKVKVKDSNGREIDIAVDVRFAKDMIEVTIDESADKIKELAKSEFIYIEVLGQSGTLGQASLFEMEIAVTELKGNQSCRVNAITTGR